MKKYVIKWYVMIWSAIFLCLLSLITICFLSMFRSYFEKIKNEDQKRFFVTAVLKAEWIKEIMLRFSVSVRIYGVDGSVYGDAKKW